MVDRAKNNEVSLIASLALFILPVIGVQLMKIREMKRREQVKADTASLASFAEHSPIRPPLPKLVQRLLSRCRLSYLSTIDAPAQSSHLSLMRFTYLLEEEVIIMSTQRKTKKFAMLEQQRGVSLLVHDFGQHEDGADNEERYRAAHLKHNPNYPQFIVGDDIAILCIHVHEARICNIDDQVVKWALGDKPN
eukprot:scaffold45905_cov51-Attheya_sp.AAC.1